ncbi:hypothetical protein D3C81_1445630 [compost metagenome]
MHFVELARRAAELPSPLFIQGDDGPLAILLRHHLNLNVPQRNVVHRLELALDQQRATLRALRHRREKIIVTAADYRAGITELDHPFHAHQRGQVQRVADLVGSAVQEAPELFAVQVQGLWEMVELLLDAGDLIHQRTAQRENSRKTGASMNTPSHRKMSARDFAEDPRGKKSGKDDVAVGRFAKGETWRRDRSHIRSICQTSP